MKIYLFVAQREDEIKAEKMKFENNKNLIKKKKKIFLKKKEVRKFEKRKRKRKGKMNMMMREIMKIMMVKLKLVEYI
jgi:hypothetical protein